MSTNAALQSSIQSLPAPLQKSLPKLAVLQGGGNLVVVSHVMRSESVEAAKVDMDALVAAGLATSTVALSLVPNLSSSVLRKVKFFEIEGTRINAVLAVRKHLMSHSSYAHFHNQLVEYCRDEYWPAMKNLKMAKFSFFRN